VFGTGQPLRIPEASVAKVDLLELAPARRAAIDSENAREDCSTERHLGRGLIPAVPVPFRGRELAEDAQRAYAAWMAEHQVAGVAVWAHTGRGPHLSPEQRRRVLAAWRTALP